MRNRLGRKILSILLSALVLAWGMVPTGIQHAHVGGRDSTHRHDCRNEVAHHASHDHDSHGGHHEHATVSDVSLLSDFVVHLHWLFLGVEFSTPVPEAPADGDDDRDTVPAAIIRVTSEIVPAAQAGPSFGRVLLAVIRTPGVGVVADLTQAPRPPNFTTSIPLCDSARLERSGVLLA